MCLTFFGNVLLCFLNKNYMKKVKTLSLCQLIIKLLDNLFARCCDFVESGLVVWQPHIKHEILSLHLMISPFIPQHCSVDSSTVAWWLNG